jgi:23S rRNA pseudouridine955/2504/2580 synthase
MAVKTIVVDADRNGQRIDNFLFFLFRKVPKSRVYKAIRKGEVRVNKSRVSSSYRLQEGDSLRIPPLYVPKKEPAPKASSQVRKWLESMIVYEDDCVLVLNKPAGFPVHGGSGQVYGVQEVIAEMRSGLSSIDLVHRLDKGTSGCLFLAKNRVTLRLLQEQFRLRQVGKEYFALVKGEWSAGERVVDAPLVKKKLPDGSARVCVSVEQGKRAVSVFKPIKVMSGMSLMQVRIETGRTHQIRVHAHHLGFPLAGDDKYGCDVFNLQLSKLGLKRLFLHSYSLSFTHLAGQLPFYAIAVPLPGELREFLQKNL